MSRRFAGLLRASTGGLLVTVLLVTVLLWRLGVGALDAAGELAALAPRAVVAALTTPLEARIAAALPDRTEGLVELVFLTPPEARILFPRRADRESLTLPSVRSLCYPRRFELFDPAQGWGGEPGTYLLLSRKFEAGTIPETARLVDRRGDLELWCADGSAR
jgi:hypothetical protein